ncbi:hypothetical protein KTR66_15200 [Roseococcus sp. SDR]|uniref:hypothetical protein n=1 Tax=Roseococcus sp. SDR TaxID=2835532 RepID=UPI001BCF71C8|nr:hypothetical protein [Roseococcus sp. SDR]MBS7791347.1 hypothetical protein [Roseococcus sp. SDR]MBV1846661.1 hypothetical protein [Roseococcus sp. SDR]
MMVSEQEAPAVAAVPRRPPVNVISLSKEEEGPVKGEFWALARALGLLIGAIVLIGYIIA